MEALTEHTALGPCVCVCPHTHPSHQSTQGRQVLFPEILIAFLGIFKAQYCEKIHLNPMKEMQRR